KYGITLNKLRKIGADHTSRIYGGRNDFHHQYLRKLACRQVVGHHESVESYGVINNLPSCNCSKVFLKD
ncbi:9245_t:CDS:1, partial [Funneliformis geosporum]